MHPTVDGRVGGFADLPGLAPVSYTHLDVYKRQLTDREKEILVLLAQGLTLARLCEAANISMATAKSHVYHIYQKMDVHSRKELAAVVMATRIEQASADGPTHPQKVDCG